MRQATSNERSTNYATTEDFCRVFKEDTESLYLLSLLLAADANKAEQLFVSGLDDCASTSQVFKDWAKSWARRSIIRNAVRVMVPTSAKTNELSDPAIASASIAQALPGLPAEFHAVLSLSTFDRFVFVLSVLESYSDQNAAALLGSSRQSVAEARVRALQRLALPTIAREDRRANAAQKNRESVLKFHMALPMATTA